MYRRLLTSLRDYFSPSPREQIFSTVATEADFINRHAKYRSLATPEVDELEQLYGFAVDRAWLDNLALFTQIVLKSSEANWSHGRVLYALLRNRLAKPSESGRAVVLDTGTARGFSALVMAKALVDSEMDGTVITVDLLGHSDKVFSNCIDGIHGAVSRKDIWHRWPRESERVILLDGDTSEVLAHLDYPHICFAFLDAQHEKKNVLEEFEWVASRQKSGDVIVFDDVSKEAFPGVWEAVESIAASGRYEISFLSSSGSRHYAIAVNREP